MIKFVIAKKEPNEFFNEVGFIIFNILSILFIILLIIAQSIMHHLKFPQYDIFYGVVIKKIIPIAIISIIIFELFFVK